MLFINPHSKVNYDIPNIDIAFAATYYNAKVIDYNTLPRPANRHFKILADRIVISIQSRTVTEAEKIAVYYSNKYPDTPVNSLKGVLNVQCCYPYIQKGEVFDAGLEFGDGLPIPDYTLFDSYTVFKKQWGKSRWMYAIMTSHGCPFPCKYCSSGKTKYKTRSIEHCVEEIMKAKTDYGVTSFTIIDDCFNVNKERVLDFCRSVKPLNMSWMVSNGLRADRFDEDIAAALKESGFTHAMFGIETIHDDILEKSTKGEKFEEIERAVKIAKKHFNQTGGFFILGLPGSSYEKDVASVKWAYENHLTAHFSYYVPADKLSDNIFYGETARPLSDEYDKKKQKLLYQYTNYFRPRKYRFLYFLNKFGNYRLGRFLCKQK